MFIIPGVTGNSTRPYVKDLCQQALKQGYTVVVLNVHSSEDHENDQRVLDLSDDKILRESIDLVHTKLGDDFEIYGVGFSLGASHLLRYIGSHAHNSGFKAAVSISNPYDVLATGIILKKSCFGIYDLAIYLSLSKPFFE